MSAGSLTREVGRQHDGLVAAEEPGDDRPRLGPRTDDGGRATDWESLNWRWSLSARQLIDLLAKISETRLAQRGSAGFALHR